MANKLLRGINFPGLEDDTYMTAGYPTEEGGEIFCDYKNNKADLHGHAEGEYTYAGWRGHAECYLTEAGNSAHAEGRLSRAIGKGSHAEGLEYNTFFSEGEGGILLIEDTSIESDTIKLNKIPVGLEVGHAVFLTTYKTSSIIPTDVKIVKEINTDSNTIILHSPFKDLNYTESGASNPNVIPAGVQLRKAIRTTASGLGSHAEGFGTIALVEGAHSEGCNTEANGLYSHTEGQQTLTQGRAAHAEGISTRATMAAAHAEGDGSDATGVGAHAEGGNTTASGMYAHTEGSNTTASNLGSHAEGLNTTASGTRAHAEGESSNASGAVSHAEGKNTEASGQHSHAEGLNTVASGNQTHAEGWRTIAASENQHVQGKCNIEDTINKYAHIVGNGTSDTKRSNAHTLDWSGNAWFAGNVYTGGSNQLSGNKLATNKYVNTTSKTFSLNNVVCIGDSFLHGYFGREKGKPAGWVPYGWGECLRDMALQDNPDAKFAFWYEGDSGYLTGGTKYQSINPDTNEIIEKGGHTFSEHIENLAKRLKDENEAGNTKMVYDDPFGTSKTMDVIPPEEVETVIILGGISDVNYVDIANEVYTGKVIEISDPYGAGAVVDMALVKFPNAKIVLAMNPMCSKYIACEQFYDDNDELRKRHPSVYYFDSLRHPYEDTTEYNDTNLKEYLPSDMDTLSDNEQNEIRFRAMMKKRLAKESRVCILPESYQWILCDESLRSDYTNVYETNEDGSQILDENGNPIVKIAGDGLHPTLKGYKRIAAHLHYASKGLNLETSNEYSKAFNDMENGTFGIELTYRKVGNNVSFFITGWIDADNAVRIPDPVNGKDSDFILIGTRPTWMSQAYDVVIPIHSTVPGSALYFTGSGIVLYVPKNFVTDKVVTFNSKATVSLDML